MPEQPNLEQDPITTKSYAAYYLIATVILMGLMDLALLGVTLAALAGAVVVIGVIVPRINRAARRAQESVGIMGAALERMLLAHPEQWIWMHRRWKIKPA